MEIHVGWRSGENAKARQAGIRQMATDRHELVMNSPLQNENLLNGTSQVNESL